MTSSDRRLRRVRWGITSCPLTHPYDLSFTQLTAYDSVWAAIEDQEGRVGVGEAVPLPGYNWETLETISATVRTLLSNAQNETESLLTERCWAAWREHPFAASAVMTALEMPRFLAHAELGHRFALSAPA